MTCGRSSASTKRRSVCRSSSCSWSKGGVTAARVVEAKEVSAPVLLVRVVVGAHFADLPVPEAEPLGAAVEAPLARLRIGPHHRPLDHGLVAVVDPVLEDPGCLQHLHRHPRVLTDRSCTYVRAQSRVVVDRVLGEERSHFIRIAAVEGVVVRPHMLDHNPYERPMTSSMISSVPAPMRFRRRSRHARSMPYSFM